MLRDEGRPVVFVPLPPFGAWDGINISVMSVVKEVLGITMDDDKWPAFAIELHRSVWARGKAIAAAIPEPPADAVDEEDDGECYPWF